MDASQDPARARAEQLDREDALAPYRETFVLDDAPRIYLDGNSLGRLPRGTRERLATVVEQEWGRDLIASWGRGWVDAPRRIGERIAPLIGAGPGQVVVATAPPSTSTSWPEPHSPPGRTDRSWSRTP
ncbi:MAG: hypothetical protein P8Y02_14125 [Deinococcales bacterium]